MNLQEKIQAIADHYGLDTQTTKLAEEGAELSAASLKNVAIMIRQENGEGGKKIELERKEAIAKCQEELADVLLVARQIEYLMLSWPEYEEQITRIMNEKADRQLARIEEEKNE